MVKFSAFLENFAAYAVATVNATVFCLCVVQ